MIALVTQPNDYGRIYDTNRLYYKMSSTNYNEPNFRFYIEIYVGDITDNPVTYTKVATVRKRPLSNGTCLFNPAEIWSNYINYDLEIGINELKECLNSNGIFYLSVKEEYGTTPVVNEASNVDGQPIMLYNGLQEYIPYDLGYGGYNTQFVMDDTNKGKYLTDATNYQVDTTDYANLYFIVDKDNRPTYARFKVYYWDITAWDNDHNEDPPNDIQLNAIIENPNTIYKNYSSSISAPNPMSAIPPEDIVDPGPTQPPPVPVYRPYIDYYYTGFTLEYTNDNNQMCYIPTGAKELGGMGLFDVIPSLGGGRWVSYEVDLTDGLTAISNEWNTNPITYYRKSKCDKYNPIQLMWLNPHGGFDRYTFYKKNYISYDVERTLWQHRFSDSYTLGERGTTVYKTKSTETTTMNTDWLTASEAQTLSQLNMSPEVYSVYEYNNYTYKIPYIIKDTNFDYKEIKNEKMVSMSISMTPAWNRTSQTS